MATPQLRRAAELALDIAQTHLKRHGPASPEFVEAIREAGLRFLSFVSEAGLDLPAGQALLTDGRAEGLLLPALDGANPPAVLLGALDLCSAVPGVTVPVAARLGVALCALIGDESLPMEVRLKASGHVMPLSGLGLSEGGPSVAAAATAQVSARGRVAATLLGLVLRWDTSAPVGGLEDCLRARVLEVLFAFLMMPIAAARIKAKGQQLAVTAELLRALALSRLPAQLAALVVGPGAGREVVTAVLEVSGALAAMSLRDAQPPLLALALLAEGGWEVAAAVEAGDVPVRDGPPTARPDDPNDAAWYCKYMRQAGAVLQLWLSVNSRRVEELRAGSQVLPNVDALGAQPAASSAAADPDLDALQQVLGQIKEVLGDQAGALEELLPRLLAHAERCGAGPDAACFACGAPAPERCSACHTARYCTQACQRGDWKDHKGLCRLWSRYVGSDDPVGLRRAREGGSADAGVAAPL